MTVTCSSKYRRCPLPDSGLLNVDSVQGEKLRHVVVTLRADYLRLLAITYVESYGLPLTYRYVYGLRILGNASSARTR